MYRLITIFNPENVSYTVTRNNMQLPVYKKYKNNMTGVCNVQINLLNSYLL